MLDATRYALLSALVATGMSPGVARGARPDDALASASELSAGLVEGPNVDRDEVPKAPLATPVRDGPAIEEPNTGRLRFTFGADITNAYFYRGIRQEDEGLIVQPFAGISADAYEGEEWALSLSLSTWNSFHGEATGTSDEDFSDTWYESDIVVGASLTGHDWTFGLSYSWFTSPSDVWETIQQIDLSIGYDDASHLGPWALNPGVTLTYETDGAADVQDSGVYLQLGIAPGFEAPVLGDENVAFSFPILLGLSLKDYYQDAAGEDETFGYATIGAKAAIPLPFGSDWGAWNLNVSANALILGDHAAEFNEDEDAEFVASVGVSVEY